MSNGDLPQAQLRVLPGFLPYPASYNFKPVTTADHSNQILASIYTDAMNMATDFEAAMHQPLTYAEAYRTIDTQKQRKAENRRGGPSAAAVGYSNHGWALAVDYRNGIGGGPGNSTYDWMHAHAAEYGFYEDVSGEHWHWHHPSSTSVTKPRTTTAGNGSKPIKDEEMPLNADDKAAIRDIVSGEVAKQLAGDGFVNAVSNALTKIQFPYNPGNGKKAFSNIIDGLKDIRNGIYNK